MTATPEDFTHMARALRLARRGLYTAHPNPRVGCVIVRQHKVVGEGWHARTGGPHAEVVALGEAGTLAQGATAYVSLEPCCHQGRTPPCTEALIRAAVARVVFAAPDPNPRVAGGGEQRLRAAGIAVTGNVLEAQARELNVGYFSRRQRQRPWLRSKLAVSLDGRTALASGDSRWISSDASRRDSHGLRARSSAILTGVDTVLADDPALTVRRSDLAEVLQPERIIVDSALRMPPSAAVLRQPGRTRIFCAAADAGRRRALEAAGAVVETLPDEGGMVDLKGLLRRLGELEMNEVLVEAGPRLNGALLAARLLDELVVYVAPLVLGSDARGMFEVAPLPDMGAHFGFVMADTRRVGPDCRLTFRRGDN
jgi:diaminohydroxyphosphoribosylaminopyrimidine deaminase/5-amino-6-(5-phosphoribosylamino)uracil reductase